MNKFRTMLAIAFATLSFTTADAQTRSEKSKAKTDTAAMAYQCPMKCEGEKTYAKAGKCPVCNMDLKSVNKDAAAYQCPMKCEVEKTYATAGKCPVCEMDLKKLEVKKDAAGHEGHDHR